MRTPSHDVYGLMAQSRALVFDVKASCLFSLAKCLRPNCPNVSQCFDLQRTVNCVYGASCV